MAELPDFTDQEFANELNLLLKDDADNVALPKEPETDSNEEEMPFTPLGAEEPQEVNPELATSIRTIKTRKKPKKADIRSDILTLREYLGYIYVEKDGQLVRDSYADPEGKKPFLQRVLARMLDDASQVAMGVEVQERLEVPDTLPEHVRNREAYAADMLYRMNVAVALMTEKVAANFQDKTGFELKGYAEGLESSKEELTRVMQQIYVENQEVLQDYISPTTALLMINANAAMSGLKKV